MATSKITAITSLILALLAQVVVAPQFEVQAQTLGDYRKGDVITYDSSYYSDCLLRETGGDMGSGAASIVILACMIKATPKKCRSHPLSSFKAVACWKSCKEAGFWSRNLGECSLG
jgi:hypothetical protein